jgi:hypothetical protein
MNDYSASKVERRVQQRLARRSLSRAISEPPSDAYASTPNGQSVPRPLNPGWTERSVSLFFSEAVATPDHLRSSWGAFEYLPSMYNKARAVYLTEAVHATALANLATSSSVTELEQMARDSYVKALHGLGVAMADPANLTKDETLAAMLVLSTYEVRHLPIDV